MALTDEAGDVDTTWDYDVFGAVRGLTGSQPNDFTFAGEQSDGSTGLQYLRARYYDPEVGRFLSKDPLSLSPVWPGHTYAYASSTPTNLVDPSGLDPDGHPDPAPLPEAGTLDEKYQPCEQGWNECLSETIWRMVDKSKGKLSAFDAIKVCNDFKSMCEQRVQYQGVHGVFDMKGAARRMESIYESSEGSLLDWFTGLVPSDIISNLVDDIIGGVTDILPPLTGSGGLRSNSKEGNSFQICWW